MQRDTEIPVWIEALTYGAAFSRLGRSVDLLEDEVRLGDLSQIKQRVEEVKSLMEMMERNKNG